MATDVQTHWLVCLQAKRKCRDLRAFVATPSDIFLTAYRRGNVSQSGSTG